MMHGHEKSDPAIVAVKPANKAERSAAELVEQRAGTKGNVGQQSTRRTQSHISVSQALNRIRLSLPSTPEVGAVCGQAARTDLCGGREVTRVPTATAARVHHAAQRRGGCVAACGAGAEARSRPASRHPDKWGRSRSGNASARCGHSGAAR
jgi:hypothetical protein